MARPVKYLGETHCIWAQGLAMLGLTDVQIAERLGITHSTLHKWKKDFPEFSDSIKEGKEPTDFKIEKSLYQRACGFDYEEVTTEIEPNTVNGVSSPTIKAIKKTKKHFPPDTGAIAFWLKNRKPKEWRDKHDVEVTQVPIMSELTFEQAYELKYGMKPDSE